MVLKIFEAAPHVGGVVLSNDNEKCKNLFKLLFAMVDERKKKLSERGVGNYAAYLDMVKLVYFCGVQRGY